MVAAAPGLDYIGIIWMVLEIAVPIIVLIMLFLKRNDIPALRFGAVKKVRIEDEATGKTARQTVGWIAKVGGIDMFHVVFGGLVGLYPAVNFESKWATYTDTDGMVVLVRRTPMDSRPSNYYPKHIPITQQEQFISDENANLERIAILTATTCLRNGKDADGKDIVQVDEARVKEIIETGKLRTKENIARNSRISDTKDSSILRTGIHVARQQEQRSGGEGWLAKYGWLILAIFAILFCYLMIDSSNKTAQADIGTAIGPLTAQCQMAYAQCGGKINLTEPNTTTTAPGSLNLPFISHS